MATDEVNLARSLQTLQLQTGAANCIPDTVARRKQLDQLLDDGLLSSEIRYLRDRLNAVYFSKDIFLHLPPELQIQVLEHLNWCDIVNSYCVSQSWRGIFLHDVVCRWIIRSTFRSQWYKYTVLQQGPHLQDWLRSRMDLELSSQKANVIYQNPSQHCFHWEGDRTLMFSTSQYKNGRVAYTDKSDREIVVRGLCKQDDTDTRFRHKQRLKFSKWWLSDQMILGEAGRSLTVYSFRPKTYQDFELPSGIQYISASGQHFAIVTGGDEVMACLSGASLLNINGIPDSIAADGFKVIGLFHHPADERCFFVVFCNQDNSRLAIQKIVAGHPFGSVKELRLSKFLTLSRTPVLNINSRALQCGILDFERVAIGLSAKDVAEDPLAWGGPDQATMTGGAYFQYARFDMYTDEFSTLRHKLPSMGRFRHDIADPDIEVYFERLAIADAYGIFIRVYCQESSKVLTTKGMIEEGSTTMRKMEERGSPAWFRMPHQYRTIIEYDT
ncbi:hypothetical protein BJ878DRAFT_479528 [Calycina marina]|uniref:F-box domain-containing protein n=1 Tax=Calycina marina TaxID=1763456 RepID=A0A9P7Z4G5_9HELO|nr:hypothetical protein BJ878DRAFT_479528 [Calycina marina]